MMKRHCFHIAALSLLLIPSCSKEAEQILSETGEKTPVQLDVRMDDSYQRIQTKALDGAFEQNDVLKAYVQQVAKGADGSYTPKLADLVSFTVGQAGATVTSDNLGKTLYWDDFSSNAEDIRGNDRYLRVGYGFCFNGGTPGTDLSGAGNTEAGKIQNWSVSNDQTVAARANVRKSDLPWAGPQTAVQYNHDKVSPSVPDAEKVKLPVTYTHAMSKLTIELRLDEGYAVDASGKALAFGSNDTTPEIYVNTSCPEVNAFAQTMTTTVATGDAAKVKMYLLKDEAEAGNKHRIYEAIIAPTVMKAGNKLAKLTVDGNTYEISLTHALMSTVFESGNIWTSKLAAYSVSNNVVTQESGDYTEANGGITLPGVNYKLVITLKKQKIEVVAKILDWNNVTAGGEGAITFNADVRTSQVSDGSTDIAIDGAAFDLWRSTAGGENAKYDEDGGTTASVDKATTASYSTSAGRWTCTPSIYWPNGSTSYFFRALAKYEDSTYKTVGGSLAAAQGTDLVWATTSAHTGTESDGTTTHNYAAGAAINPRTGNVPLTFEHAMSKITVKLKTASDASAVVLTGAKITITNLHTSATVNLSDGSLTLPAGDPSASVPEMLAADDSGTGDKLSGYIVVPQALGDASKMLITLADGTKYTLQINQCTDDGASQITTWLRGKHYTYTISLGKELITFRAMVKEWEDAAGSGNATLDWD